MDESLNPYASPAAPPAQPSNAPRRLGRNMPAPGARKALALLLAINLFNYIDRYVLSAAIAPIRQEFFTPDDLHARFWTGTLATAFLVSYMLAAPIFGLLADRISRWKLIGGAVAVWSLASGASGLAPTFLVLLLTRMCVGIGEAAYGPAAPALISDLYPIERRGRVLSWFYMAIPVGSALGFAFGGVMVEHAHWRQAFYAVVPPGLLLALLCFWMRDPGRGASDVQPAHGEARWRDYLTLVRTPSYVLNTLGMTAMTFAVGGVAFWMPYYIHEFRGQPHPAQIGLIFGGLTALAGLTATLLGGLAGDKLTKRYPVRISSFQVRACWWHFHASCSCSTDHSRKPGPGSSWPSFACFSTPAPPMPSWPTSPIRPCARAATL